MGDSANIYSELKYLNKTMKSIDESLKIIVNKSDNMMVQEYVAEKSNLPKGYPSSVHD